MGKGIQVAKCSCGASRNNQRALLTIQRKSKRKTKETKGDDDLELGGLDYLA